MLEKEGGKKVHTNSSLYQSSTATRVLSRKEVWPAAHPTNQMGALLPRQTGNRAAE